MRQLTGQLAKALPFADARTIQDTLNELLKVELKKPKFSFGTAEIFKIVQAFKDPENKNRTQLIKPQYAIPLSQDDKGFPALYIVGEYNPEFQSQTRKRLPKTTNIVAVRYEKAKGAGKASLSVTPYEGAVVDTVNNTLNYYELKTGKIVEENATFGK